jgi:ABC-type antimicrobial peptide transport system permease subunit
MFGDDDPIGRSVVINGDRAEIIGVVRDVASTPRGDIRPTVYHSHLQFAANRNWALKQVIAMERPLPNLLADVRRELAAIDPALPLYNVRTLAEHVERSLYVDALRARLISALALLAVALAAVGIYGLISFVVTERTKEVGLRLALGAQPSQVLRFVLSGGSRLALAGIALGVVLSSWLARSAAAQVYVAGDLYGVKPTDVLALAGGALFLYAIVLVAALIPALRVLKVDPMTALREW